MTSPAETYPQSALPPIEDIQDQPGVSRRWVIGRFTAVGVGATLLGSDFLLSGCSSADDGEEAAPTGGPAPVEAEPSTEQDKTSGEFEAKPAWQMDFSKAANGTPIDQDKLKPNLNPEVPTWNDEKQAYTNRAENMRVEGGAMVVTARVENYKYPGGDTTYGITAARLETYDSNAGQELADGLTFNYGKVEVVAKLPEGKGVFAAPLWLVSANSPGAAERVEAELEAFDAKRKIKMTPEEREEKEAELWGKYYKMGGEIDVESYGDPEKVELTAHTMNTPASGDTGTVTVDGATDGFHTYGIEVTPTKVTWTVDGKPVRAIEKKSDNPEDWPFTDENQLYVVTNLAMGGPAAGPIDKSKAPWKMHIQSLSYYPLAK